MNGSGGPPRGGGGVLPEKLGEGVQPDSSNPLPFIFDLYVMQPSVNKIVFIVFLWNTY